MVQIRLKVNKDSTGIVYIA